MKYLQALLVSTIAVFAPIKALFVVTAVLITADLITGVLAARKRGEPITSAGLRRTVSKSIVYEVAIALAFLTEKYMLSGAVPVVKLLSGMIGTVELKSVLENMNYIAGTDILKAIASKLGSTNT